MHEKVNRILCSPPMRTLAATTLLLVIALPLNKLVIKPLLGLIPLEEDTLASIRFIMMLPFLVWAYTRIFRWIEKREVTEWGMEHFWQEMGLGFVGGFCAIGFTLLILVLLGEFTILGFYPGTSVIAILNGFIILAMLALFEELIYRGVLYRVVQDYLGTFIALAVTGLIFGMGHFTNDNSTITSTLAITVGGALMGCLYTLTGRLWVPSIVHISWNFCQVFFGVTLSGVDDFMKYALFESKMGESSLLTGGAFGPENSIITIIITTIILAYLIRRLMKRKLVIQPFWSR